MATIRQRNQVERKLRELIADNGLPEPDVIEHGFTCVRALWFDRKLAVVIDIDSPPDAEDDIEWG